MRASNGDNSDCHLPFISDGLNFEQAINKTSISESSDSLGNQANPVPSGLVATPEFITVSGSDSAFPFTQSNGLQSFQTISDVNDSLLGTVATNDILPQNTLQSQVDSLLGGSNDVYMSTMDNLDANLQQSSSDFKNAPDTVVIINLRDYEKTSVSSLSSPGTPPIDSPSSPNNLIIDADTQASLIQRSENLNLETLEGNPLTPNTSSANGLWGVLDESAVDELPCKAHKPDKNSDAPSSLRATHTSESETLDVDRITAMSAVDFAFSKIEPQTSGAQFTFGTQSFATSVTNTELKNAKVSTVTPILKHTDVGQKANSNARSAQRKTKEPNLSTQFPSKSHGFELRILEQPEEQHRARYMTEGSRGAVKDQSQQGYPVVQLFGPVQTALLQVFVGTDTGKVKPHPFYQACKVSGKNSTPCTERDIDSTTTIEIELSSTNDLMASIDCVGILKLRNADVEQRIGVAKTKKRSTRARMVFRAIFNRPDGVQQFIQVTSSPIVCTQPVGQPEVSRLSLTACSVKGGKDLFIIGKNFMKGTKVFFRETGEENKVIWEKEADIEKDYFQPTHLICVIPEYFNLEITKPVSVNLVVSCSGKLGDPRPFTYQPLKPLPKVETPMEVEPPQPQPLPFGQCPNTLELLRLLQQNPQGGFQVPSETLPPAFPSASTVPQSSSSFSDRESASETKCAFSPSFHEQSHQSDSQFASQLESSSNFHSQTPVQNSPVQSPPQLHSSTQFQSSNPSQPPTDQGFQQTTQLQSPTDEYLSTTQMTPSSQMHSSAMEMHTSDDYQTAATQQQQQHHQQQSPSSQQLNSSLTDFHSMSEMTDSNSIKSSPMLTNNSSQFPTQTFSFNEAAALLQSQQPQHHQLHPSTQMNMSNTHIQFQASQQQSNSQMHLSGSGLHLSMADANQFQTSLKMPMTNSVSKLTSHQPQQNPLQSLQCQSENQALRQTQFQVESQTQPSAQAQSTQFSQLMSSALPSASAPQIIIVGNPRPVSGRSNVFSLGGNSQQPAPSIFIIPSLSTINENSVSQQDNDVLSLLDSLLRGNNCNNNNMNHNNNNNDDDSQLQQQQQP